MMPPDLHSFDDIHAHSTTGPHVLTSVEPCQPREGSLGQAWYSVGIHPWNTDSEIAPDTWCLLEEALADPRVIAVGEAGLDRHRGGTPAVQEEVFRRQALLAEQYRMPLIIHCVGRYGRLMELKKELVPAQPWIIHGFTGKPELARQLVAAGFGISLGQRSAPTLREIIPAEHRFEETDL